MNDFGMGLYAGATEDDAAYWSGMGLYVVHNNHSAAKKLRVLNPTARIGLRWDDGTDAATVDTSKPAIDEAHRIGSILALQLQYNKGVYDFVVGGINEGWTIPYTWRSTFELALCRYIQNQLGYQYAWGSIAVANLNPEFVQLFKEVFAEAWATNYHAYVSPMVDIMESTSVPYYTWRFSRMWLPELKKLGITPRLLIGETGCFHAPVQLGFNGYEERAQQLQLIYENHVKEAKLYGYELVGTVPFGVGVVGKMKEDGWEIDRGSNKFFFSAATPQPQGLNGMLRIAIIPSNQDKNPVLGGTNEKAQVEKFANTLFNSFANYTKVEAKVFNGKAESVDTYQYSGLIENTDAAYLWLTAAPSGTLTVALNLHTDSGSDSHVGFYYCNGTASVSGRLAKAIGEAVARVFGTSTVNSADYSQYIFSTHMRGSHAPVLIELGSHQNIHDVEVVNNLASDLSHAIVDTTLNFFTIAKDVKVLPPTTTFNIGQGFRDYLNAHPEAGQPRHNEQSDIYGNTYVWLTATAKYPHGAELQWRKYLNKVQLVSWE
jgi:hypothetical protein